MTIHAFIYSILYIVVSPATGSVHIGVSDIEYSAVNDTARSEMSHCVLLDPPVQINTVLDQGCPRGVYGRYMYVSLLREGSADGYIQLYEVRVNMGE